MLPGIVGTIQATEAIKLILGVGESLAAGSCSFDALTMEFRTVKLRRDPDCPICGDQPTITALIDYEQFCGITPATTAAPALPPELIRRSKNSKRGSMRATVCGFSMCANRNEYQICRIPGSTLIPLGELPKRLAEIPQGPTRPTSSSTARWAAAAPRRSRCCASTASRRAKNLKGGILAWIDRVDPSQAKYDTST